MKKIFIILLSSFVIQAIAVTGDEADNESLAYACMYFNKLHKYQSCLVKRGAEACKSLLPPIQEIIQTDPSRFANPYINTFKAQTGIKCAVVCGTDDSTGKEISCAKQKEKAQKCILAELKNVILDEKMKCGFGN